MATINRIQKFLSPPLWGGWVGLLISFSGCISDPIYNTDHPDKAKVKISTDWNDRGTDVDKPSGYIISAATVKEEVTADTYTLTTLLDPGNHLFYLYNSVTQIPVTDGIAKVNTITGPQKSDGLFIEPLPGWLFTGIVETALEADSEKILSAVMHQQVRQLTLLLDAEGGMAANITSIEGYLTGVAGEFYIESNMHSESSNVTLDFSRIAGGTDAGKWSATVRLLGIIPGQEQKLIGTIRVGSNSSIDMVLESDLSPDLVDFNSNKKIPLKLGGEIIEVPTGAGFTATIKEWQKVNGGSGTAK
ncbi:MAG: hypothetical protein LUH10_18525 [Tannerellaceae bacterium]|nr:hypothetical protein [Tannerellaceae bacterium]